MKKLKIFFAVLIALTCLVATLAMTISAQETKEAEKTITVSYLKSQNPTSSTTTLDKVAHADGKITVNAGEKFTLPTAADNTYSGQDGYVLVWYTENGRTYLAGEEVAFTEDTRLYRCLAKEVSTKDELQSALQNNSTCAILTADIEATSRVAVKGEGESVIVMNGHNINFTFTSNSTNDALIGSQRSGKFIIGKGTITADDTKNSVGRYAVLQCQSHSHNGDRNKSVIGVDVTVNAPEFRLFYDGDGARVSGYPWVKIYGKINVASLGYLGNQAWNSQPRIQIFDSAEVTTSMSALIFDYYSPTKLVNTQKMCITIEGGIFNLPEAATNINYWTSDFASEHYDDYNKKTYSVEALNASNMDEIVITGGSFNVKLPDGLLANGYECVYNAQTGYYDVEYVACTSNGSNGVHSYNRAEMYGNFAPTCTDPGVYYFRCDCGSYYVDGVSELGHDYSIVKITKMATATENGKKLFICSRCDCYENGVHTDYDEANPTTTCSHGCYYEEYSFDVSEIMVELVVKDGDTAKTVIVKVSDAYDITDGVLKGIKTFADPSDPSKTYNLSSIVKLVIPTGVTSIPTKTIYNSKTLEEIVFIDGANATLEKGAIDSCSALAKIVAENCTLTFKNYTVNNCSKLATIDITNANATFEKQAFSGNTAIKHLLMGSGHTYNFGLDAFRSSGLEEVILPDNSNVKLSQKSFAETTTIKYVYIGKNCISTLNSGKIALGDDTTNTSIFGGNAVLSKVVMMDIEYVSKWTFSVKTSGSYVAKNDIYIYCHADSITFNDAAINDRKAYNVYIYANDVAVIPTTCNYVIYEGIPHRYVEGGSLPTCTTQGAAGYTTDCPCGIIADAEYTVTAYSGYTGDTTGGTISVGEITPALGHEFDPENGATVVETTPASCLQGGTITYKCARCDETTTIDNTNDPKKEHNIDGVEFEVSLPATCLTDGLKVKLCKDCKLLAQSEVIPATGHTASGVWEIAQVGTCTLGEIRAQYCKNDGCSQIVLSEADEPVGHTPSNNWIIVIEQTCLEGGAKYQRCSACNSICQELATEALGHEFDSKNGAVVSSVKYADGFNKDGKTVTKCARCEETKESVCGPIFTANGYAISDNSTGISGGYRIDLVALKAYEDVNGKITFGMVIVNPSYFEQGTSFFDAENKLNSAKGLQLVMTSRDYKWFNCSINGFSDKLAEELKLIITSYVIDENGNVTYIQSENDYALSVQIGENVFDTVTLNLVKNALKVPTNPDAILPSNDEE